MAQIYSKDINLSIIPGAGRASFAHSLIISLFILELAAASHWPLATMPGCSAAMHTRFAGANLSMANAMVEAI